ncbi:hypothetical protein [Rhodanobacter denitrificans]
MWDHSTFTVNRYRLFDAEIAQCFFAHTVRLARLWRRSMHGCTGTSRHTT